MPGEWLLHPLLYAVMCLNSLLLWLAFDILLIWPLLQHNDDPDSLPPESLFPDARCLQVLVNCFPCTRIPSDRKDGLFFRFKCRPLQPLCHSDTPFGWLHPEQQGYIHHTTSFTISRCLLLLREDWFHESSQQDLLISGHWGWFCGILLAACQLHGIQVLWLWLQHESQHCDGYVTSSAFLSPYSLPDPPDLTLLLVRAGVSGSGLWLLWAFMRIQREEDPRSVKHVKTAIFTVIFLNVSIRISSLFGECVCVLLWSSFPTRSRCV